MEGVLKKWRPGASVAARLMLHRNSGSITFKLDAEAASHITSLAAAEAKTRGCIAGAGIGSPNQKVFKSKALYHERVVPALIEEFGYPNMNQVPLIEKVCVFANFRLDRTDASVLENTLRDLYILTGQRPTITKADEPISGSSHRIGDPVGCKVTLRHDMMYPFLDKLLNLVAPKARNLQSQRYTYGFFKENYKLGTKDYSALSEDRLQHINQKRGILVALVTGARSRVEAKRLLMLMGLPYLGETSRKKPKDRRGRKGTRVSAAAAPKKGAKAKTPAKGGKKKK